METLNLMTVNNTNTKVTALFALGKTQTDFGFTEIVHSNIV